MKEQSSSHQNDFFFTTVALKLVADCVDELFTVEVELATLLFLTSDVVEAELGWLSLLLEENPLLLRLMKNG